MSRIYFVVIAVITIIIMSSSYMIMIVTKSNSSSLTGIFHLSIFLLLHFCLDVENHLYIDKIYGLLTKCEVKMTGYWPSFFCVFMDRDGVEVPKYEEEE